MVRGLWMRIMASPFQVAISAIIVVQAIITMGGWGLVDPVDLLLPGWLATGFGVAYLTAGLAWLLGLLLPRGDVEGFGLWLLGTTLAARGVMFGVLLGWGVQSISALAFSGLIAAACAIRVWVLHRASRRQKGPAG